MMRMGLFFITNMAVMMIAGIVMNILTAAGFMPAGAHTGLLVMCLLFGFGGALVSLFMSKGMAKRSAGVQLIETPRNSEEQWLVDVVKELADKAGIGMPEVGIFPSEQPNAFATGANKNAALVAVSVGMMKRFPKNEVRAVMAHEIGHVANGDMVTLTLIQGVVNTFVMFFARLIGGAIDRAISGNRGGGRGFVYYIAVFVMDALLGVLATIIVRWFSRRREFRADYAGATFGDKQSMIDALLRLKGEGKAFAQANVQNDMPDTMSALGISSMGAIKRQLFATHPSLDVRIEALRQLN